MLERYGADRLWMNSACDWGERALAVPQAAIEMRRRGHTTQSVDKCSTRTEAVPESMPEIRAARQRA